MAMITQQQITKSVEKGKVKFVVGPSKADEQRAILDGLAQKRIEGKLTLNDVFDLQMMILTNLK